MIRHTMTGYRRLDGLPRDDYQQGKGGKIGFAESLSATSFPLTDRMNDAPSKISTWFVTHADGEFVRLPGSHPYSITSPSSETRCVLYTTKPASVLAALEEGRDFRAIQVVGRAGLPNEGDAAWLRGLAGGHPMVFLGDADPADLLVFAWLRSQMPLSYGGERSRLRRSSILPLVARRWERHSPSNPP